MARCGVLRHATAKAKVTPYGQGMQQPRPRQPSMGMLPRQALIGMLPRLGHVAAKAKVAPMGRQLRPRHTRVHAAKAKAMATLMGKQSMPRHVAKATTCLCGHASLPLGAGSKASGGM